MSYAIHPAAELFPLMSDDELAGLIQDIRENGQRESATFWNGQLIDGRNRATACERLGIELDCCELDPETDPVKWVLSHNLHRRHLTPSQKSQVALKLKRLLEPEAKERQRAGGGDKKSAKARNGTVVEKLPQPKTRDRAAKMLGISGKLVDAAETVDEQGDDDLKQAVTSGKVSVTKAAKVAKSVAKGEQLAAATKKSPKRKKKPAEPPQEYDEDDDAGAQVADTPAPRLEPNTIGEAKERYDAFVEQLIDGQPPYFVLAMKEHSQTVWSHL